MGLISVGEVIQRVQSMYSKGVHSDDTRLTSRHIYSALITARAIILRQQASKNQLSSQWIYQSIPCIELIKSPIHECPCIPTAGCIILRTKYEIPKPITGLSTTLIQSVTTIDGKVMFDETTFETVKYNSGNKFTSKKPNYYIRNQYLYITIYKELKTITINGLFDDPIEAGRFPSLCPCTECECSSIFDMDFPLDGGLIRPMLQIAYDELIVMMKQMTADDENDAEDDTPSVRLVHQNGGQDDSQG